MTNSTRRLVLLLLGSVAGLFPAPATPEQALCAREKFLIARLANQLPAHLQHKIITKLKNEERAPQLTAIRQELETVVSEQHKRTIIDAAANYFPTLTQNPFEPVWRLLLYSALASSVFLIATAIQDDHARSMLEPDKHLSKTKAKHQKIKRATRLTIEVAKRLPLQDYHAD